MSRKPVEYALELDHLPPLTQQQRMEIAALETAADGDIDYSDSPPLDEDFWKKAIRNPFYHATKTATTVRIDSDVLV